MVEVLENMAREDYWFVQTKGEKFNGPEILHCLKEVIGKAGPDSPQRCAVKRQEAEITNCSKGNSLQIKEKKKDGHLISPFAHSKVILKLEQGATSSHVLKISKHGIMTDY